MRRLIPYLVAVAVLCATSAAYAIATGYASHTVEGYSAGTVKAYSFQVPTGFGVNYGHFTFSYSDFAPNGIIQTDLATFKAAGVKYCRIALLATSDSRSTGIMMGLATTTAASGCITTYGYGGLSTTNNSSSTIGTYFATVLALEPTMQLWHVQDFTLCNECEEALNISSISIAQFQIDAQGYACVLKAMGFTGTVSIQSEDEQIANWNTNYNRAGCLDYLGFNVYSNFATNAATIVSDFGSHGYISEFNASGLGDAGFSSLNSWAAANQTVLWTLANSGLSQYDYFDYRGDDTYDSTIKNFGVIQNGVTIQPIAQILAL